mmetsp:Transcript_12598/g.30088  ORF Transcript_12598/g.30088 Transcript_12598/m.30088 type:complete len:95 (-) Transcript_12598:1865-2149(-)
MNESSGSVCISQRLDHDELTSMLNSLYLFNCSACGPPCILGWTGLDLVGLDWTGLGWIFIVPVVCTETMARLIAAANLSSASMAHGIFQCLVDD